MLAAQFISVLATGVNNVDLQAASERKILVSNVRDYSTDSVVAHTLTLGFSLLRRIPYYQSASRGEKWSKSNFFCHLGPEIPSFQELTWGIIGYGSQGKKLHSLLSALGFKVEICESLNSRKCDFEDPLRMPFEQLTASRMLSASTVHSTLNRKTSSIATFKIWNHQQY